MTVSQNLEELKRKPTIVQAGTDDRNGQLHSSRFLGGPVCSNKILWQKAREVLGEKGVEPLANFDLGSVGLGGVRPKKGSYTPALRDCNQIQRSQTTGLGGS